MNDSLTKRDSISTSAKHRDALSPTPWRVEIINQTYHVEAADGGFVALFVSEADAALIVEGVNGVEATRKLQRTLLGWSMERDRLRDLVRRLAEYIRHSYQDCGGPCEIDIKCSCKSDNYHGNAADILREAREVLVEGEP